MIPHYTDHAANERTFLAWVRTGIAVIAFGFVIEKFNLFLIGLGYASSAHAGNAVSKQIGPSPLVRYDGTALIVVGLAIIVISAGRFVRTSHMIDDDVTHAAGGVRAEVILAATLALIVAAVSAYTVLS
jgi:putative membrane protein